MQLAAAGELRSGLGILNQLNPASAVWQSLARVAEGPPVCAWQVGSACWVAPSLNGQRGCICSS